MPKEIFKKDTILNVFVRNANTGEPWYYRYSINGNCLYSKKLFDHNVDYILKNNNDTGYVMTLNYFVDTVLYREIRYFDQNLDTLWTYTDSTISPIGSEYFSFALLNNSIACKYIIQNFDSSTAKSRYCLFDYYGNLVYDTISTVGGYLFSYINNYLLIIQPQSYSGITKIAITDTYLNIIDSTTINMVLNLNGNNIYIDYLNGDIISYSSGLYFLNSNLDSIGYKPIWEICNGFNPQNGSPHDIKATTNGGYALAGLYHYDLHDMGFLFNLDENLSVINNNIYSYWYIFEWVERIIPLDDGSFILMTGAQSISRVRIFHTRLDGSVSFEELSAPKHAQIFPNPVVNYVTVVFGEPASGNIIVSNILGEQVWNSEFSDAYNISIPAEQLYPGVYILTVTTGNKNFTSKICKQ